MSRYQLTDRLIEAAPALYEFVEDFIKECERQGVTSRDMPLLKKARFVSSMAGDHNGRKTQRVAYAAQR